MIGLLAVFFVNIEHVSIEQWVEVAVVTPTGAAPGISSLVAPAALHEHFKCLRADVHYVIDYIPKNTLQTRRRSETASVNPPLLQVDPAHQILQLQSVVPFVWGQVVFVFFRAYSLHEFV